MGSQQVGEIMQHLERLKYPMDITFIEVIIKQQAAKLLSRVHLSDQEVDDC